MWLGDHARQLIASVVKQDVLTRDSYLWRAGDCCDSVFYIKKGIVRIFFVTEQHVEHTLYFARQDSIITDFESLNGLMPSSFSAITSSDTEIVILQRSALEKINTQIPGWNKLLKKVIDKHIQDKMKFRIDLINKEPKAKLEFLLKHIPEILQHCSIEQVSSCLDIPSEELRQYLDQKRNEKGLLIL